MGSHPKLELNRWQVRSNATAIWAFSIVLLFRNSAAFAQASADPSTLQSRTDLGDQNKQLADQIIQLQKEIASLQADIDPTGPGKKLSIKSGMNPAPPTGKIPMTAGTIAMGMKDDQGEMRGMSTAANSTMSPPSPALASNDGMAGAMGSEMGEMMKPPRQQVYPSLMALPDNATPEMRAQVEQLALTGMKEGTARLSSGLENLSSSTLNEDYTGMQQAAAQMREGLAQFEAAIAARRMLAEGKAPRNVAIDWFKREMNLASPIVPGEPRTLLGVKPFHLFTMTLLIVFALAMVAIYFFKMRRASALFGRFGSEAQAPPHKVKTPESSASTEKAPSDQKTSTSSASLAAEKTPATNLSAGVASAVPISVADDAKTADRADELWKARGRPFGSPKIDWLRAEKELANEEKPVTPPTVDSPATTAAASVVVAASS